MDGEDHTAVLVTAVCVMYIIITWDLQIDYHIHTSSLFQALQIQIAEDHGCQAYEALEKFHFSSGTE